MRSGERMSELLNDLLDFNRVTLRGRLTVSPKRLDLGELAHHEMSMLQAAHAGTTLQLSVSGSCKGMWDASRIGQVLANLANQALSAAQELRISEALGRSRTLSDARRGAAPSVTFNGHEPLAAAAAGLHPAPPRM